MAGNDLKPRNGSPIKTQRSLESTGDFRVFSNDFKNPKFQPCGETKFEINGVSAGKFFRIELGDLVVGDWHQVLAFESCSNQAGGFWALVERGEKPGVKVLIFIHRGCFDGVVKDSDLVVGVCESEVKSKVVMELGVVCEVELGECGVCDIEFDLVGYENEP